MQCKCGYLYSSVAPPWKNPKVESYAVIDDRTYTAFLRSEARFHACRDRKSKFQALGRSSEYVGVLLRCPRCSRLLFLRPSKTGRHQPLAFYTEDRTEAVPPPPLTEAGPVKTKTKPHCGPRTNGTTG
jgi:hypothetical protein